MTLVLTVTLGLVLVLGLVLELVEGLALLLLEVLELLGVEEALSLGGFPQGYWHRWGCQWEEFLDSPRKPLVVRET